MIEDSARTDATPQDAARTDDTSQDATAQGRGKKDTGKTKSGTQVRAQASARAAGSDDEPDADKDAGYATDDVEASSRVVSQAGGPAASDGASGVVSVAASTQAAGDQEDGGQAVGGREAETQPAAEEDSVADEPLLQAEQDDAAGGASQSFHMPEGAIYEPEQVLVAVDPQADPARVEELLAQIPGVRTQAVSAQDVASGLLEVELEAGAGVEDVVNAILDADASEVIGSQPNYVYHIAGGTAQDLIAIVDTVQGAFAKAVAARTAALQAQAATAAMRAQAATAALEESQDTAASSRDADADGGEAIQTDASGTSSEAVAQQNSSSGATTQDATDTASADAASGAATGAQGSAAETFSAGGAVAATDQGSSAGTSDAGTTAVEDADDEDAGADATAIEGTDADDTDADTVQSDAAPTVAEDAEDLSPAQILTRINDPLRAYQWNLVSVRANDAWELARCDGSPAVAVVDNGFNLEHEDLAANVIEGSAYNSVTEGTDVSATLGNHGTHVAGIVAGVANNGVGVAGVSYNARIVPIKAFDEEGNARSSTVVKAYRYIEDNRDEYNIRVINLSLGHSWGTGDFEDDAIAQAAREAAQNGIVTVAAACNADSNNYEVPFYAYPSDSAAIVSVMALVQDGDESDASGTYKVTRYDQSNYNVEGQGGTDTDQGKNICAPGASIYSTLASENAAYGSMSGTSMASPLVAGIVALEFAANPSLTADAAVSALYQSAHDLGAEGWDEEYGYGEADAYAAVRAARFSAELVLPEDGYVYDRTMDYPAGVPAEPAAQVTLVEGGQTTELAAGVDFTVSYSNNVDAGTATATITGAGDYEGAFTHVLRFDIAPCPITDDMVSISAGTSYYDARAITRVVTVTHNGVALSRGSTADYTRSYANNVNAGTVTITVTGRNNYTGTVRKTHQIVARSLTASCIQVSPDQTKLDQTEFTYTGSAQTPALAITHTPKPPSGTADPVTLTEGTDYTLAYTNNVNAGTASVTATGLGNYCDSLELSFVIGPATIVDADVTLLTTRAVVGGRPGVSVAHDGMTLEEGTDFELAFAGTDEPGTGTVTVEGKGNYQGTVTKTFAVVAFSLADAKATVASATYTGSALTPAVNVTYDGTKLTKGTDYTLAWSNNVNAGTGKVTITGKGNYAGTIERTFAIAAASISKASVSLGATSYTYNGSARKPVPTLTFGGTTLKRNTDYTLAWSNNTNAGTGKLTITGMGNFKGSVTKTFTIARLAISSSKVSVASVATQAWTGSAIKPTPVVKFGSTTLTRGTDYALSYKNNKAAGTATITITGKGNFQGTRTRTFKIVKPSVQYYVHRQTYGWEDAYSKADGQQSGTTGESKRLEGIRIRLQGKPVAGSIQYRTHVQTYGWEEGWKSDGAMSGTTGQSKRLEAIQIRLTGNMAKAYDVYYRVHAQRLGWMGWAKNGASAGTAGYSYRLEAIQVVLVPKGGSAPAATYRGATRATAKAFVQR